ncbi:DUF349 domain-containing protein [Corynebacterium lizhenjunii]|uniref:DUF349 domain-containing protein n=1 Tax=Corynebacterium lizhenjunii TaxID=2709394 RepID=UPI0013E9A01D|nr:DUF349 domain-containing protein [Corynebacterium lizhenjunii]
MTATSPAQMPKPGPRPGPRPGTAAKPSTSQAVSQAAQHPEKFGRVGADGTVYRFTPNGELIIGQWQAGTPEEGLAHYAQRFADLATEVELLETRLQSHPEDAEAINASAHTLRESLPEAAVIGDVAALDSRLSTVIDNSAAAGEKAAQDKQRRRAEAIAHKEALAAEAEELASNSTEWKEAGDRIRDILEEWKLIRGIDRKTDDGLWKRYSRARDSFNRRRGSHFADLDRARAAARKKKEELVERAEALKDSTDWNETARAFRDLMGEWKAAGRAPREIDDKLWAAFRGAQDYFFNNRNAVNVERDKEFAANAAAKDALLDEYGPQIDPESSLPRAKAKLLELQEKWEEIGFVPRNQVREYEDKIAALERRVSDAEEAQWRRSDPEAQARVAQFQAKADGFHAQAEEAAAAGKDAKAELLRQQAAQWQEWADAAQGAVDNA